MSYRPPRFDYSRIPVGYYQEVVETGNPVRRAWHLQKFERVVECLANQPGQSILDVGCFAGTFLSRLPESTFSRQLGVDILESQVGYANERFGTPYRSFRCIPTLAALSEMDETFDYVTVIEVIEHLREDEIRTLVGGIVPRLKRGGRLILSTPNYCSTWPLLEHAVNRLSDVKYEEQHITTFNYFNCLRKLSRIAPDLEKHFQLQFRTSTHFVAPFLASLSLAWSMAISRLVRHQSWKNPFGNLILLSFIKK